MWASAGPLRLKTGWMLCPPPAATSRSSWNDPERLTTTAPSTGNRVAPQMAAYLRTQARQQPWCSTSVRTRATWRIAYKPMACRRNLPRADLYEADADELLATLRQPSIKLAPLPVCCCWAYPASPTWCIVWVAHHRHYPTCRRWVWLGS